MIRLVGLLYIIPGVIYYSFFIHRFIKAFTAIQLNRKSRIIIILIVILLSIPAINFIQLYGTIYFHLLVISFIYEVFNIFLKKFSLFKNIFYSGGLSILSLLLWFGYGYYNMNEVVKTEYQLVSNKVDDLVIANIADMHMSTSISVDELKEICLEISKENPDFVFLTGDIFDENTPLQDMERASYELSKIKNTKGIYYIYGNHDSLDYAADPAFNALDIRNTLEENGIVVLDDEVTTIDNISIIGRKDAHFAGDNPRLSMEQLLGIVPENNYKIVLDHQPLDFEENKRLNVNLQLSGHTHGGQMFPMRQMESFVSDRLVYGLKKMGTFNAITSSGISGWGYPIKTGAISEYVIVKVK